MKSKSVPTPVVVGLIAVVAIVVLVFGYFQLFHETANPIKFSAPAKGARKGGATGTTATD